MRDLTFAGFLKSYVRSLSKTETNSLYKLTKEAADENPRLREPLFLYAKFTEYKNLANRYDKAGFEAALQNAMSPLPEEYKKVWKSYLSKKNRLQNDNHTKELMRNKVVKLQKSKGVSNYRLYADLGLNPGNFNAWLKYGDPNKVSLDTARRAVKYFENKPQTRL
jgi:hypothetical protein